MGVEAAARDEIYDRWWDLRSTRAPGIALLLFAMVAFFVAQEMNGRMHFVEDHAARWDLIRDGEPLRIFTGSLLNYRGVPHIAANAIMLLMFGRHVDRAIGPLLVIGVFFVGGALAFMAMFAGWPGAWGSGSSGGVTAVLGSGAVLAASQRAWEQRDARLYLVSVCITMAVVLVVDPTPWGLSVHAGGFAAGVLLGGLVIAVSRGGVGPVGYRLR